MSDENLDLNKNTELDSALKEFEEKSKAEEAKKVSRVAESSEIPKMTRTIMKWTGAKDQRQAEYLLLGFVIIAMGISIFLFIKMGMKNASLQNSGSGIIVNM